MYCPYSGYVVCELPVSTERRDFRARSSLPLTFLSLSVLYTSSGAGPSPRAVSLSQVRPMQACWRDTSLPGCDGLWTASRQHWLIDKSGRASAQEDPTRHSPLLVGFGVVGLLSGKAKHATHHVGILGCPVLVTDLSPGLALFHLHVALCHGCAMAEG